MNLTIAVTTFNRQEAVVDAVRSVCSQDGVASEVIIVDDASNIPVRKGEWICDHKCVPKISVHEKNKGLAASRNTAIEQASGEYFSFCDDDDQWPPGLASRLVEGIEAAPDKVGMAVALSEDRKASCGHLFHGYPRLSELMKAGLTPPSGSQIYRTELLRQVGGYRPDVPSGVDHDLWISLARIDPRVAVAWGEPAIVGSCPSRERMTTVEHRRRAGIEKSLAIWRDDLCEVFGESFYNHFVRSYQWYLDYSFFVQSIQKKEFLDTAKRAFRNTKLPIELVKRRLERLSGRSPCTLFPEYRGD